MEDARQVEDLGAAPQELQAGEMVSSACGSLVEALLLFLVSLILDIRLTMGVDRFRSVMVWIGRQQDVAEARGVSDEAAQEQEGGLGEADAAGFGSAPGERPGTNRSDSGSILFTFCLIYAGIETK